MKNFPNASNATLISANSAALKTPARNVLQIHKAIYIFLNLTVHNVWNARIRGVFLARSVEVSAVSANSRINVMTVWTILPLVRCIYPQWIDQNVWSARLEAREIVNIVTNPMSVLNAWIPRWTLSYWILIVQAALNVISRVVVFVDFQIVVIPAFSMKIRGTLWMGKVQNA